MSDVIHRMALCIERSLTLRQLINRDTFKNFSLSLLDLFPDLAE